MISAAAWVLLGALAQDDARLREGEARYLASEARSKCRELLTDLDGVRGVNYAGAGTDYRLILVVRDSLTQKAAREILRGDACQGVKIIWSVSSPTAFLAAPPPAAPLPTIVKPFAAPAARPTASLPPPAYVPSTTVAPVEMRRTFYAGPVTVTPRRRYDGYSRYANCSPSRYGFLVGGFTARPCATPAASYAVRPPTTCSVPRPSSARPAALCFRPGRPALCR